MVVLIIMLITGFFLTMNYKPSADDAFNSVSIMRSVENGWLIRYMHSTECFTLSSYIYMFRQCCMDLTKNLVNSFGS